MIRYLDFDLVIKPTQTHSSQYRASVVASPVGKAETEFTFSIHQETIDQFFYQLYKSDNEQLIKGFGSKLYEILFKGSLSKLLDSSLDAARQQDNTGLRVGLDLTEAPELGMLPWEYLYDPEHENYVFAGTYTSLVRYIKHAESSLPPITLPLTILVVIASPQDYEPLDVEKEWATINTSLAALTAKEMLILDRLDNPSLKDIQKKLRSRNYHIFHFIGHGGFIDDAVDSAALIDTENQKSIPMRAALPAQTQYRNMALYTGESKILLVSSNKMAESISGRQLGGVLRNEPNMRLVFLNTCHGARSDPTNYASGVAQGLVKSGIPAVVAMQSFISDQAAIEFAHDFYGSLADGYPIDAALGEGRTAIFTRVKTTEWGIPTLHTWQRNSRILDVNTPIPETVTTHNPLLLVTQANSPAIETMGESSPTSQSRTGEDLRREALVEPVSVKAAPSDDPRLLAIQQDLDAAAVAKDSQPSVAIHLYEQSLSRLEQIQDQKRTLEVLLYLSELQRAQGNVEQANRYAERGLDLAQQLPDPLALAKSLRIRILGAIDQQDDSAISSYFELAIKLNIQDFTFFLDLGDAFVAAQAFQAALSSYRQATKLAPQDPRVHQAIGAFYQQRGQFDSAEAAFRRAVTLAPENSDVSLSLSRLYVEFGDYHRAVATLQKATQATPQDTLLLSQLGQLHYRLGQFDMAQTIFASLLESSQAADDYAGIYTYALSLADLAEDQRMYELAIKLREQSQEARGELQAHGQDIPLRHQIWLLAASESVGSESNYQHWSDARRPAEQSNLRSAQIDDLVLLYSPSTNDLVRYANITNKPSISDANSGPRRQALELTLSAHFSPSVPRQKLEQALPGLQYLQPNRALSFSPVTPAQWAVLRSLVLYDNANLSLPPTIMLPNPGVEVIVDLPSLFEVDHGIAVPIRFRNIGNTIWLSDQSFEVTVTWSAPNQSTAAPSLEPQTFFVKTPTCPGATVFENSIELKAPSVPNTYTVSLSVTPYDWPASASILLPPAQSVGVESGASQAVAPTSSAQAAAVPPAISQVAQAPEAEQQQPPLRSSSQVEDTTDEAPLRSAVSTENTADTQLPTSLGASPNTPTAQASNPSAPPSEQNTAEQVIDPQSADVRSFTPRQFAQPTAPPNSAVAAQAAAFIAIAQALRRAGKLENFQAIIGRALEAALSVTNIKSRLQLLVTLAPQLTKEQRAEVLTQAFTTATTVEDEATRAQLLAALAPQLSTELLAQALTVAQAIQHEGARAHALTALAPCLPEKQRAEVLRQALTTATTIEDEAARAQLLAALAPQLSTELLAQALAIAQAIQHEEARAYALTALAPYLPEDDLAEVLSAVQSIQDENRRIHALTTLVPSLSAQSQEQILTTELATAQTISDETARAIALSRIAQSFAQLGDFTRASAVANTISRLGETKTVTVAQAALPVSTMPNRAHPAQSPNGQQIQPSPSAAQLTQLRLDAAVPEQVQVGTPFDLAISVRHPAQPQLQKAALPRVESGVLYVESSLETPSLSLRAELIAEQCTIHGDSIINFRLPHSGEPPLFYFHLTPKTVGDIGILIRIYQQSELLGSATLHTAAKELAVGQVELTLQSVPVQSGATTINRQPPLMTLPAGLSNDQETAARVVYQNVWQNFLQAVERPQESFATRTLDINIQPRYDDQVSAAQGIVIPDQVDPNATSRQYWVVLTLHERLNGQFAAPRYFEGPIMLDTFKAAYEKRARGDFRYGQSLFKALFHQDLPDNERRLTRGEPGRPTLLAGYLAALSASSVAPLRLQLRIDSKAIDLHNYQWEYLWDTISGSLQEPLACSELTPFSRVLQVSGPGGQHPPHIDEQHPLRILAAIASPQELESSWSQARTSNTVGLQPIERAELEALANGLNRFDLIEKLNGRNLLDGCSAPVTLTALQQRLEEASLAENRPFHVLHLLCHGMIGADNRAYVVLEQENGGLADPVPEDLFAERIGRYVDPLDSKGQRRPGLRLVVLASCFTAKPTQGNSLRGIARRLVETGVPAVIAMQHDFQYEAAQYFSQRLYAHLIHHGEIDRAVNAARLDLWDHRKQGPGDRQNTLRLEEWGIPVLFMRLADGQLFTIDAKASQRTDPNAKAQIVPYEDSPSGDRQRLLQATMQSAANQLGLSIGLDTRNLMQLISETIAAVTIQKPKAPEPAPAVVRLFGASSERKERWMLVKAANDHRCTATRRTVLFLRSLAREQIARLVSPKNLPNLKQEQTLKSKIWEGGYAELNGQRLSQTLVGPGPRNSLVDDVGNLAPTSGSWRRVHRQPNGLPLHGNLIWSDDNHPYPKEQLDLAAWRQAVADLLLHNITDNRYIDRFKAFDNVIAQKLPHLNQQIASLLLHAVAPDEFVPYFPQLAETVLNRLWPQGGSSYDPSYRSFCALAKDLRDDDELSFENLADVAYFLQRFAAEYYKWETSADCPTDCLPALIEPIELSVDCLDSTLVVRDSVLTQSVAALNSGKHIILTGPPGTGKTTLAEDICRHARDLGHCRGHILVTATADWTTADTIGGYMPDTDGRLVFRPGVFLNAIRTGKWLVIDEINRADIDKSFGELFTVLSGQKVTLPYLVNGQPISILPAGARVTPSPVHYVIHPNWRIIGTMNQYDKASLFAMSYAFMRRFAFVEVDIPDETDYSKLLVRFLDNLGIGDAPQPIKDLLLAFFNSNADTKNPLMRWRALGPAIAKDLVSYLGRRVSQGADLKHTHLAEAFSLYVIPQFEGLERDSITEIYAYLNQQFPDKDDSKELLGRIRALFPYVRDWPSRPQSRRKKGQ